MKSITNTSDARAMAAFSRLARAIGTGPTARDYRESFSSACDRIEARQAQASDGIDYDRFDTEEAA